LLLVTTGRHPGS